MPIENAGDRDGWWRMGCNAGWRTGEMRQTVRDDEGQGAKGGYWGLGEGD